MKWSECLLCRRSCPALLTILFANTPLSLLYQAINLRRLQETNFIDRANTI